MFHEQLGSSSRISFPVIDRLTETGFTLTPGVPRLPEDAPEADTEELSRVAALFKLPQLQTICLNRQNEEEFLNPSIGTFLNDETGTTMKALFFNQPEYADVIFNVQGRAVSQLHCI